MKSMIGVFLVVLALCGCRNAEPVKMDTGTVAPSSSGKCQDFVAGRMVDVACPK